MAQQINTQLLKKTEKFTSKHPIKIDKDTLYVFCTDSKGSRLIDYAPIVYKFNFLWLTLGGRSTASGVNTIINELDKISSKKPFVKLIFWHGTCDITVKQADNLIYLRNNNCVDAISNLKLQYEKLKEAVEKYHNVRLYILEIPPISISKYNKLKGSSKEYKNMDELVEQQVQSHNEMVRGLNDTNGVSSPMFSEDLKISKKRGGSKKHLPPKHYYDFSVTTDGVHPKRVLAKKWMHKIIDKVNSC